MQQLDSKQLLVNKMFENWVASKVSEMLCILTLLQPYHEENFDSVLQGVVDIPTLIAPTDTYSQSEWIARVTYSIFRERGLNLFPIHSNEAKFKSGGQTNGIYLLHYTETFPSIDAAILCESENKFREKIEGIWSEPYAITRTSADIYLAKEDPQCVIKFRTNPRDGAWYRHLFSTEDENYDKVVHITDSLHSERDDYTGMYIAVLDASSPLLDKFFPVFVVSEIRVLVESKL